MFIYVGLRGDGVVRIKVCAVEDVLEGQPLFVDNDRHGALAVYRQGNDYYITEDACTHAKASLTRHGEQHGFVIKCSWHAGAFDIRTGKPLAMPCTKPLKVYKVEIEAGSIYTQLE